MIRAAIAVGVNPWSASATSTDSNTRASPRLGPAGGSSQNASSPKPTLPISVAGEVVPEQPDVVGVGGAERGRVRAGHAFSSSQARISAPCSSSPGGGST